MASQITKSYKRKTFDTFRDEELKKQKNKKRHYQSSESRIEEEVESKTPPLPTGMGTIEELIKQRESLQKELNRIGDSPDDVAKSRTTEKKTIHTGHIGGACKKYKSECLHLHSIRESKTQHQPLDASPYFDENSEDEENIIEVRRRKRKLLMEKLKSTHKINHAEKEVQSIITSCKTKNDKNVKDQSKESSIQPIFKTSTDMFADIDDFTPYGLESITKDYEDDPQLKDNWDDADGYFIIRIGDSLNNQRYTIKDTYGQGVFAKVVRAQDTTKINTEVAVKITRNNDLMKKTALKEIEILKQINDADPDDKYHCVKLLRHFIHKEHLCLVLEPLYMDMRCIIKKYAKHGLTLKALVSFSKQLLLALRHLKKLGIIHADVKPDNVLVNKKMNLLKLCDFGSAGKKDDTEPTPYLVSRFYRAPEIILGVTYSHGVDMWSAACTIYEMAVGKILFTGASNNRMLKCFMDVKGRIPNKLVRRGKFKDQHFNYNHHFLLHKKDPTTGRDKVVELTTIKVSRDLGKELAKSMNNDRKSVQLKELLDKMLTFDPGLRITPTDALKHIFIKEDVDK